MSKHVGILEHAGLVHSRRRGRERLLELESGRLQDARRLLADVAAEWEGRLGRLRRLVEQ